MPIRRAAFGLVTQLLDFCSHSHPLASPSAWEEVLALLDALAVGAAAEEVTLGDDETIERLLVLQDTAERHGLELFLRLRELAPEALWFLRERVLQARARLAPGETGPPGPRVLADLGQPGEQELTRWLSEQRRASARGSGERATEGGGAGDGPAGGWSPALAFSIFASDGETALRQLDRVAASLLEAAGRPGVEQPVWLAAFHVGEPGAPDGPGGVLQVAAHALALGIERVFLAAGPEAGWWPADLRNPSPVLLAFRTFARYLDGADGVVRVAAGQYRIEFPDQPPHYLLWKSPDVVRRPDLPVTVTVTTALGERRRLPAAALRLTDEPVFVAGV
jgi:hypothetical protein